MTVARRIGSALEALLLVSFGAAVVWVALGDRYAVLMNPKFRLLTIVGGGIVAAMGAVALVRPRRPSATAILAFVALAVLVLVGRPLSEETARSLMTAPTVPDVPILEDPDFPLMELRDVLGGIEDGELEAEGLKFTAMGQIRPIPGPAREFVFLRSYMICCVADAQVTGFRVSGEGVGDVKDGEWVAVSGRLSTFPVPRPVPRMRIGAASFPNVSAEHELVSSRIVRRTDTLPSVAEQLGSKSLVRFREALEAAGLMKALEGPGPFTVFAPIDAAFGDTPLDAEVDALRDWASWHVVEGTWYSRDLFSVTTLRTIHGRDLRVTNSNGRVQVEGVRLVFKDVRARNGIVHLIYPSVKPVPGR
jgi:uncharacterized surface protein with fasciclin (FAS1) repeats